MLLQRILHQLDAELVRLQSLRAVMAKLAASPSALRGLAPQLDQYLTTVGAASPSTPLKRRSRKALSPVPAEAETKSARIVAAEAPRSSEKKSPRLPRTPKLAGTSKPSRLPKPAKAPGSAEAAIMGGVLRSGPVVVSAAALLRERETRAAAKAAARAEIAASENASEPEVRPELFARELAARWLAPAAKL